jgi:hypothetical protein
VPEKKKIEFEVCEMRWIDINILSRNQVYLSGIINSFGDLLFVGCS